MWLNMFKIFTVLFAVITLSIILIVHNENEFKKHKIQNCLFSVGISFALSIVIMFVFLCISGIISKFTTTKEIINNSQHYPLVYLKDETNKSAVTSGEYHSGYFLFCAVDCCETRKKDNKEVRNDVVKLLKTSTESCEYGES